MWRGTSELLVLAVLGLLTEPSLAFKDFNITIGYLSCITGEQRDRQGLTISGAISMALEELNNDTSILPDVKILLEWHDTKCDVMTSTRLITDMSCAGVVAFFGPEGHCNTEAIIAQSKNLPMFSYKCSDNQPSKLSNFVRLEPSVTQATNSVISLLRYYRWNKFSIIYDESWETVALTLENHAKKNNMTVNHRRPVIDSFKCCEEKMTCCATGFWYHFIQNTMNYTRIYVFLGSTSDLIDMMTAMDTLQLFKRGEYMVIFVDMIYSSRDSLKYLIHPWNRSNSQLTCSYTPEFKKRSQSLLVVASSEPSSSLEEFNNKVREYNTLEPFKFPTMFGANKYVSVYAAYLYDSVKLYAKALDEIIKEDTKEESLTQAKLLSYVHNGRRIVSKIIKSSPYKSVSGMSIHLDEQANSQGSFSVLAFKQTNNYNDLLNCNYSMVPVAHFHQSSKAFPEYKPHFRLTIDWPDNIKPEDEPLCGFNNEKCSRDNLQTTSIVNVIHSVVIDTFNSVLGHSHI